jgi:hypothetical protein
MNVEYLLIIFSLLFIMDNSVYLELLAKTASAVASAGWLAYKMKKRHSEERVFVILHQRKCGLTTQLKHIKEQISHNCVITSTEDCVASVWDNKDKLMFLREHSQDLFENEMKPLLKEHIQKLLKIHRRKLLVLFTSDHSIVEYLKISPKRVCLLLPTLEFNRSIMDKFEKDEDKHLIQHSRENILVETSERKYPKFLFRSYEQLESVLERLVCPIKS